MKNLFKKIFNPILNFLMKYNNKYCEYIGIRNNGYKRLIFISYILWILVGGPLMMEEMRIWRDEDVIVFMFWWSISLPIILVILFKIFFWIKDGFNSEKYEDDYRK